MSKNGSSSKTKSGDRILYCSFCGKSQHEVRKLIAGPSVFICDECVDLCNNIIREEGLGRPLRASMREEEFLAVLDETLVGQGPAKRVCVKELCRHLAALQTDTRDAAGSRRNLLLVGPAGTGKSTLVSTLARIGDLPIARVDAAELFYTGYFRRKNVLEMLLHAADRQLEAAQRGIVYIDQFERLLDRGRHDSPRLRVQESLLPVIQGSRQMVSNGRQEIAFETSGLLFVIAASISTAMTRASSARALLLEAGILPELLDLFAATALFEPLDATQLATVLTRPDGGLIKQFRDLFADDDLLVSFSDAAVNRLASHAAHGKRGARSLRAVMDELTLEVSREVHDADRGNAYLVDVELVERVLGA